LHFLFLSVSCPVPVDNGSKMRTWAMLRALTAEGHRISLLAFADPFIADANGRPALEGCHAELVPHSFASLSSGGNYTERLRGMLSQLPYGVLRLRSEAMERRIRQLLESGGVDAVISEQTEPLVNLPPLEGVPLVLDNQNVEHLILRRYLALESNPAKLCYAWLEHRRMRQWERLACHRATVGLACSKHDQALLQALNHALPVFVVPNVVDVDSYTPAVADDGITVIYQGGMDWYPNRDAIGFFVSTILPDLRRLTPRVRFVAAGRNPADKFRRRFAAIPDVVLTGTVPDMREQIASAAVCVVPLRIGSGTRLKILEAAAMAKPIVSTHLGAEGLDFVAGQEIILADKPDAFARAVAGLLADAGARRALGQAARRRVERSYDFPVLRAAVREALTALGPSARSDRPTPAVVRVEAC
jgi:polysaccharide biosynthesis protein PslH